MPPAALRCICMPPEREASALGASLVRCQSSIAAMVGQTLARCPAAPLKGAPARPGVGKSDGDRCVATPSEVSLFEPRCRDSADRSIGWNGDRCVRILTDVSGFGPECRNGDRFVAMYSHDCVHGHADRAPIAFLRREGKLQMDLERLA